MKTRCIVSIAASILSYRAMAEESDGVTASKVERFRSPVSDVSVELKPLPTLLSVVPGVGVIAIGLEGFVATKLALFADIAGLNSALPHAFDDKAQSRDQLYPRTLSGGNVDLGARYYGWLHGPSWYTGAKIGYTTSEGKWEYKDQVLETQTASITPGVQLGYRWLWPSSFLMRLGVGAAANLVQKNSVESDLENADVAEARDDLQDGARIPLLASVDLGLGYQF